MVRQLLEHFRKRIFTARKYQSAGASTNSSTGSVSAVSSLEQGVDINSVLCGVSSVTVHCYTIASAPALDTPYTAAITVNYKIYTA